MTDKKKFGLVMPKKAETKVKKSSIFDNDSDDDEKTSKRPKIPQKKIDCSKKAESMEDPSIYEYDDIYDEMKRQQKETIAPKEKKNSRYIETLMKAAEKRKKVYERRIDKKIQAEREKEGDKFKDKEAFVTSSYKKKMLEQEEEEEKERRESMLNDMMDVTKQKDLSGFYRHFLKQAVGEEKVPQFGERTIKEEVVDDKTDEDSSCKPDTYRKIKENVIEDKTDDGSSRMQDKASKDFEALDRDSDNVEIDSDEGSATGSHKSKTSSENENERQSSKKSKSKTIQSRKHSKRHYRGNVNKASQQDTISKDFQDLDRDSDNIEIDSDEISVSDEKSAADDQKGKASSDNENDRQGSKRSKSRTFHSRKHSRMQYRKKTENSNKSSDSSDNEDNKLPDVKRLLSEKRKKSVKTVVTNLNNARHDSSSSSGDDVSDSEQSKKTVDDNIESSKNTSEKNVKINIYAKRTVGDIFAEAQARYFQRMASRKT